MLMATRIDECKNSPVFAADIVHFQFTPSIAKRGDNYITLNNYLLL